MAQLARQPSSAGVTSRGQQHAVCMKPATTATGHHEPTADVAGHGLNRRTGDQLNPGPFRGLPQAIHHCGRAIRLRKHPAVVLLHQIQAAIGEPCNGITTGKTAERPAQGPLAPGVVTHQLGWIPTGMGHVAATASTQSNLGQGLRRGFQHQDSL